MDWKTVAKIVTSGAAGGAAALGAFGPVDAKPVVINELERWGAEPGLTWDTAVRPATNRFMSPTSALRTWATNPSA